MLIDVCFIHYLLEYFVSLTSYGIKESSQWCPLAVLYLSVLGFLKTVMATVEFWLIELLVEGVCGFLVSFSKLSSLSFSVASGLIFLAENSL